MEKYSLVNIVIDCDGVLTDGSKFVDYTGRRKSVVFNAKDDQAINRLKNQGFRICIVTQSAFPGIHSYWARKGVEVHCLMDKAQVWETLNIKAEETVCVGDDISDRRILAQAALSFCPSDAHPIILLDFGLSRPKECILGCRGGDGVMAHVETFLIGANIAKP